MGSYTLWQGLRESLIVAYMVFFWPVVIMLALGLIGLILQLGFVAILLVIRTFLVLSVTLIVYLIVLPFAFWKRGFWLRLRRDVTDIVMQRDLYKRYAANKNTSQPEQEGKFERDEPLASTPPLDDPHSVLGVSPEATNVEIKKAYRQKMMMNHPDKLSGLDPELQKIATARAVKIAEAYDKLVSDG